MKIDRNKLPSVPPIQKNLTKLNDSELFEPPSADKLPPHPKPAAKRDQVQVPITLPEGGLGQLYHIIVNFLGDSTKGKEASHG